MIRVHHRTLSRRSLAHPLTALACVDAVCSCGRTVERDEPVVWSGAPVVQETDGAKHVDLTGGEWRCQQHTQAVAS